MGTTVRKVREEDFERGFLETIENLTEVGISPQKAKEIYRKIKGNPVYEIFVAELDGKIVGTTILLIEQKFIHGGTKAGHLEEVVVKKGFEGRGIGKRLVEAATKEAKAKGCYRVTLECSEENVPFYEKCGFKRYEVGMRIKF